MKDDFRQVPPTKPADSLKQTSQANTNPEPVMPFLTPEQVREHDGPIIGTFNDPSLNTQPRPTILSRLNLSWPPSRPQIIAMSCLVVFGILGVATFLKLQSTTASEQAVAPSNQVKTAPKPTTVASTLSGLQVPAEVNQRPVVGVMIENSASARPQSGLSHAGVVFEAVAEGGITRFLALFQDQQPGSAGPIRSARPYYVQWNEGFRAAYAHVGGSPDALASIKNWGVQDMNQFTSSAPYHRVSSRPSPHNMYASVVDLAQLAIDKGYKSAYSGFPRKTAKPATQPNATSVDLQISSNLYNVHYGYDAKTNTYLRSQGGTAHMDNNTSAQIAPSVVVALVMPMSVAKGGYSNYNPIGSGQALIFQDGTVTNATWTKASNTAQISFNDASGAVVALNPGQTWISAVSASSKAVYR